MVEGRKQNASTRRGPIDILVYASKGLAARNIVGIVWSNTFCRLKYVLLWEMVAVGEDFWNAMLPECIAFNLLNVIDVAYRSED